jgi:hypothetical protein
MCGVVSGEIMYADLRYGRKAGVVDARVARM